MLSMVSSQKISMTSRESTPRPRKIRPISLAKETLTAWKALQAYFSASALRDVDVPDSLVEEREQLGERRRRSRGSSAPTTTNGGSKKSRHPSPRAGTPGTSRSRPAPTRRAALGERGRRPPCSTGARAERCCARPRRGSRTPAGAAAVSARADLGERPAHVGQVGAAVAAWTACPTQSSETSAPLDRLDARRWWRAACPPATASRDQVVDARLDDRALALADRSRPCMRVDVDADDVVAAARPGRRR